MVLHAGGNVFSAFDLFTRGRSEWQASPTPKPLIWDAGADASFWISVVAALIVGAAAVWAYAALAKLRQLSRVHGAHPRLRVARAGGSALGEDFLDPP